MPSRVAARPRPIEVLTTAMPLALAVPLIGVVLILLARNMARLRLEISHTERAQEILRRIRVNRFSPEYAVTRAFMAKLEAIREPQDEEAVAAQAAPNETPDLPDSEPPQISMPPAEESEPATVPNTRIAT